MFVGVVAVCYERQFTDDGVTEEKIRFRHKILVEKSKLLSDRIFGNISGAQ